ncbi:hypothetical protein SBRCBS47491_000063 [Sporothrix bragantina]|uniref:2EXR domain-containing protein n=1 Tax=Sporothrix bragantina TaxID=671064 RepID=A0ABP0AKN4_9PEZI
MTREFHNFMRLPGELRNMVWKYALPARRVYEIMDVPHAKKKMKAVDGLMFANVHHEPPPALAAVCRESRRLVMHHYQPLTLSNTTKYVDLSRDLLLLEPYLLLQRLHRTLDFMSRLPMIRDNMAGLALGTSYGINTGIFHPVLSWRASKSNMVKLVTAMAKFPKLKDLLFIIHQDFQFEFDAVPDLVPALANPSLLPVAPYPAHPPPGPEVYSTHSYPMAPQPAAPRSIRPQVIHQAYRFKFDVEGDINRSRRRPHLNRLLFYPLQGRNNEAQAVNWEDRVNDFNNDDQADGGLSMAERTQLADPWPTNRDWDVFYDLFHHAVAEALRTGLAKDKGENAFCVAEGPQPLPINGRKFGIFRHGAGGNSTCSTFDRKFQQFLEEQTCNGKDGSLNMGSSLSSNNNSLHSLHSLYGNHSYGGVQKKKPARRYKLKYVPPTIHGASLQWRYVRGA